MFKVKFRSNFSTLVRNRPTKSALQAKNSFHVVLSSPSLANVQNHRYKNEIHFPYYSFASRARI